MSSLQYTDRHMNFRAMAVEEHQNNEWINRLTVPKDIRVSIVLDQTDKLAPSRDDHVD
jgi:hypothetical protein